MNGLKIILRLGFILWLILITILSVIPIPEKYGAPGSDKVAHFIIYFITTSWLFFAYKPKRIPFLFLYGFFAFVYSTGIEVVQFFLSYRNFSIGDIVANISGILSFTLLWLVYLQISRAINSNIQIQNSKKG